MHARIDSIPNDMNAYLVLNVLLLQAYLLVEGSPSYNLTFMFITSFGEFGLNSSGVVPAAEMAVRDINNRSALLPGYVLNYDVVRDSQVSSRLSMHYPCSVFDDRRFAAIKLY